MPRHHTRLKQLSRLKAAAEQTSYKAARRALQAKAPTAAAGPERFTAPQALAAALRTRPVIGAVSAANGAGVSVLAANLALAWADQGWRVLVLDTESPDLSPWREDAAALQVRSRGRVTAVQISYQPYLMPAAAPQWVEEELEGRDEDYIADDARREPLAGQELPEPTFDPDAVPQLVGDDGMLVPLDPRLIEAHDKILIDASLLGSEGNFAGDLLAGYASTLIAPLQLRIEHLAPEEEAEESEWSEDQDGEEDYRPPRLGEPYPAPEVVRTLLRSRTTSPPPHLPGTDLAVTAPPTHDEFRLDPDFPAEFDRLMANSGAPVLGPWIPRLPRPHATRLALAEPGSPAAAAYARIAGLLMNARLGVQTLE